MKKNVCPFCKCSDVISDGYGVRCNRCGHVEEPGTLVRCISCGSENIEQIEFITICYDCGYLDLSC